MSLPKRRMSSGGTGARGAAGDKGGDTHHDKGDQRYGRAADGQSPATEHHPAQDR